MENTSSMMKSSTSTNTSSSYFFDWIISHFLPSCIVYSSENAKKIIGKNNLTPAEFLRPFGNFSGTNINFTVGDKFTINMKNLKLDFYDSERFSKFSFSHVSEITESLLTHPSNYPEWSLNLLASMNLLSKFNCEPVFRRLKNFSFPWFNEYEKLVLEMGKFNEFEMYQQPFANIYIISSKDDKKDLEFLQNKKNTPLMLHEGIYEMGVPSMILMLNDKSTGENTSYENLFKTIQNIQSSYKNFCVLSCDINSNKEESVNEVWSKYFHNIDFYKHVNNYKDLKYGQHISADEKENFKSSFLKFFNEYIKNHLQRLVLELDDEITANKKGIKNGFLSIFKKSEKVEYVNVYNIYKLTPIEKKLYLLSVVQFFFRDYENAMDHAKILMGDIKSKSTEHYNSLLELYTICQFIAASGSKKEVDIEAPYNAYLKTKNTRNALRYLIIMTKMLEQVKRFNEIPKYLIKATSDLNIPFLSPLLLEKASVYYLLMNTQIKKFVFFQVLSGLAYKGQSAELKRYALHCFGNIHKYFSAINPSFLRTKEYLNSNIGDICLSTEYYDGALKFFKNCIELSTYKNIDQDQALYIRHFLKSLNSVGQGGGLSYVEISELSIPEVINSSLLVIEEQDYEIGVARNESKVEILNPLNPLNSVNSSQTQPKNFNWGNLLKYSKVDINKTYINLSENDVNILKNLDNISENKQNFSNFHSKRYFKTNVGCKIYVRFFIKNPLNLNLSISSLKLLCDFIPDKKIQQELDEGTFSISTFIEMEEKVLLLEKNSSTTVTLSCVPKVAGRIVIHGLEIGLYKIALFKHSFYKKDVSDLFSYRERRGSTSSHSSSNSNLIVKQFQNHHSSHSSNQNNPKEICFDVLDDNQDIKVIFPFGKEIELYLNEFMTMPILIKNNSKILIKRFCILLDDSEIVISKNSSLKNENNVCLCDTIFKEAELPKDSQYEILLPICPKKVGEYYLKILVKFEEESKFREIDVKRFLVKFNVKPSIKLNINEEILFYDSHKTVVNLEINKFIENREQLSGLKVENIYYPYDYAQEAVRNEAEWKILDNQNYHKLYTKLKFTKTKDQKEKNKSDFPKIFDFLHESVMKSQPHITDRFNYFLSKDFIFFNWTAKSTNHQTINGLTIYECKLKQPSINKTFLKTVFKNSITTSITQHPNIMGEDSLVTISMKLNKVNIEEMTDISAYEVYISDEDNEFTWIGLTRYKIFNSGINKNQSDYCELNFNLMTPKKGNIEINKFAITIFPKNSSEKPFHISNIPNTIIFQIAGTH